jgi:hypothetical protein
MKVEIRYNPAAVNTDAAINEVKNDENDIYSFIFPVKNYPLQCWINKNSSWAGISKSISDISRGDDLNIVFDGRRVDFLDFKYAIDNYEWSQRVEVCFTEKSTDYGRLLGLLKEAAGLMLNIKISNCLVWDTLKRCDTLKQRYIQIKSYIREIHNINELKAIVPELGCTYIIYETALGSFEDFEKLLVLYSSMLVPMDSIMCVFSENERMQNFTSYAMALNCTIMFSLNKEDAMGIYKKYSEPVEAHYRLNILQEILCNLKKLYSERDIDDRLVELKMNYDNSDDNLFEKKREELIHLKKWRKDNNSDISSFIIAMEAVEKMLAEGGGADR